MDEIKFAVDTFYAIMAGALVMFMAAGFTMLEAGLVQKKDVSEIVTKIRISKIRVLWLAFGAFFASKRAVAAFCNQKMNPTVLNFAVAHKRRFLPKCALLLS